MLDSTKNKITILRELYPDANIKIYPKDNIDSDYNSLVATVLVKGIELAQVEIPFNKNDYGSVERYKELADNAILNCIDVLGIPETIEGKEFFKKSIDALIKAAPSIKTEIKETNTASKINDKNETVETKEDVNEEIKEEVDETNVDVEESTSSDEDSTELVEEENKPKRGRPRKITRPNREEPQESILLRNVENVVVVNTDSQSYYDGFPRAVRNAFYQKSTDPRNKGKLMYEIYESNPGYLNYLTTANFSEQKRQSLLPDIEAAQTILNYFEMNS